MRRVTMHSLYAGPERAVQAGDTADFEDEEAARLVDGGFATYADKPAPDGPADERPVEKMTADQLRALAADKGYDLGDAKTKAEILAAVVAAIEAAREADGDDD
ncbi:MULTISPECIES: hypothetical protein [unclassified Streptomyces]|uniref:hypothetical protein n=1 Tax=unclassified Streptomyces TaxID=2593676 RepID=UPI002270E710|nr:MULTISPECIES: hypothetical protein [unclassified Streptomyces]MCY0919610.1 hypothetical protein [Streptomyces sp. H27-G5]MCY0957208.1 hypothetical protein [Streptomyces sp. H27-H5]